MFLLMLVHIVYKLSCVLPMYGYVCMYVGVSAGGCVCVCVWLVVSGSCFSSMDLGLMLCYVIKFRKFDNIDYNAFTKFGELGSNI